MNHARKNFLYYILKAGPAGGRLRRPSSARRRCLELEQIMHRQFKELLPKAVGVSEFVVAINLDVRGFSSWMTESSEAALFLKQVYLRILDKFFADASFFKPTGDGLLVLMSYTEDTLRDVLATSVKRALELVEQFPSLCVDDPMINFPVPTKLGIGMARGAAARLTSEEKILDYSGRPLNLASRLMDLARPRGVVFDGSFGLHLLSDDISNDFATEQVYIRSLAESEPIAVHYSKNDVVLPSAAKQPIDAVRWEVKKYKLQFKELKQTTPVRYELDPKPSDSESVQVRIEHDVYNKTGKKTAGPMSSRAHQFFLHELAGRPGVHVRFNEVADTLAKYNLKGTTSVTLIIEYPLP